MSNIASAPRTHTKDLATLPTWTPEFDRKAWDQGWNVFFDSSDSRHRIMRVSVPGDWDYFEDDKHSEEPRFASDAAARRLVLRLAKRGEPHAMLALQLDRHRPLRKHG